MLEIFPALADVAGRPEAEAWLLAHAEPLTLAPGQTLMEEGDPIDYMYLVLEGEIELLLQHQADRKLHLQGVLGPGAISGVLPYSRLRVANGRATARTPARLLRLHRRHFQPLVAEQPALAEALVHQLTNRVRDFIRQDVQAEKLTALGQMAATLAHELNNPAAALGSLAQALGRRLGGLGAALRCAPGAGAVGQAIEGWPQPAGGPLSGLAQARARQALEDYLADALGLDPELATDYADAGYQLPDLQRATEGLPPAEAACLLALQGQVLGLQNLAQDMAAAAGRISTLVQDVKSFTHMDQGQDLQPLDLDANLATAVRLMLPKFRQAGVVLANRVPDDLPWAVAPPGALGQVWTNLLDNALDAARQTRQPPPTVTLEGGTTGGHVWISVADNGPGIAEADLPRIFEPFFTTKPVGEGTGLGLELVRRVVTLAGGDVQVQSAPGQTVFTVVLPVQDAQSPG